MMLSLIRVRGGQLAVLYVCILTSASDAACQHGNLYGVAWDLCIPYYHAVISAGRWLPAVRASC